jgi:hypothetical protein
MSGRTSRPATSTEGDRTVEVIQFILGLITQLTYWKFDDDDAKPAD